MNKIMNENYEWIGVWLKVNASHIKTLYLQNYIEKKMNE